MAREGSEVLGILPLVFIKHWFMGRFFVSMPYLNYGGVCAETEEVEHLLVNEALRIARLEKAEYVELHQLKRLGLEWQTTEDKVAMFRELEQDPKVIMGSLHKKVRYKIRKAEEHGLQFEICGPEALTSFYDLFVRGMRSLGSPAFNKRFFEWIFREFGKEMRIAMVRYEGNIIATAISGSFKDKVDGLWASSVADFQNLYPNEFMYWKHLEYACKEGFRYFDFGRSSKESGPFEFKKKFGAQVQPLYYQYCSNKKNKFHKLNYAGKQYQVASNIWKHLPLSVAKIVGPRLRKYMPQ
jgi:FemAB-related protein (PEP-CTERM system-associated)